MNSFDLPELALIRVLNQLPAQDQLNARLVCRQWKLITDNFARRDELVLFLKINPRPVYWFHDGSEVDPGNAFLVTDWAPLKNKFFLRYFRKVRRMMTVHQIETESREVIDDIQTSFHQLENLQFKSLYLKDMFSKYRWNIFKTNLQLANLRTLYLETGDFPLGLHCPQLTELYVYSHLKINQATDEQTRLCIQNLRFLSVNKLTYPPGFEFSNLEIFYFNELTPSISLNDFPHLKELHYFDGYTTTPEELPDCLDNLFEQKRQQKRKQLNIYFDGFKMTGRDSDFDTLDYLDPSWDFWKLDLNENVMRFMKEFPSRLKFNLLSKHLVMSDALDDELTDLPEGDLLMESMYKSVKYIVFEIPLTKQSLNLFELSNRFRYVSVAQIDVELGQTLLDRLSDALPHLLYIYYYPAFFKNHILNFEFIAKFKSLGHFKIYRNLLSIEEFRVIMESCKFIECVTFLRLNAFIRILATLEQGFFEVEWYSSDIKRFATATFSTKELYDYLEASKLVVKNDFLGESKEKEPPLNLRSNYLYIDS